MLFILFCKTRASSNYRLPLPVTHCLIATVSSVLKRLSSHTHLLRKSEAHRYQDLYNLNKNLANVLDQCFAYHWWSVEAPKWSRKLTCRIIRLLRSTPDFTTKQFVFRGKYFDKGSLITKRLRNTRPTSTLQNEPIM